MAKVISKEATTTSHVTDHHVAQASGASLRPVGVAERLRRTRWEHCEWALCFCVFLIIFMWTNVWEKSWREVSTLFFHHCCVSWLCVDLDIEHLLQPLLTTAHNKGYRVVLNFSCLYPLILIVFLFVWFFFFYICGNLISMWVFRSVTDETLCFKELFLIITRNVFVLMTCFSSRQTDSNLPPVVQLSGVDRVPGIWPECLVSCSSIPPPHSDTEPFLIQSVQQEV